MEHTGRNHRKTALLMGLLVTVAGTSALVGYWASTALALQGPTADPLYYSGLLTDTQGAPLASPQTIGIDIYDAKTGGTKVCFVNPKPTTLVQGRFRIGINDSTSSKPCTEDIFETNPNLWVDVTVYNGGVQQSMGRTQIGAVPYVANPSLIRRKNASLTIHSETHGAKASKMLVLKSGTTAPSEVFSVDDNGVATVGYPFQMRSVRWGLPASSPYIKVKFIDYSLIAGASPAVIDTSEWNNFLFATLAIVTTNPSDAAYSYIGAWSKAGTASPGYFYAPNGAKLTEVTFRRSATNGNHAYFLNGSSTSTYRVVGTIYYD